MVGGTSEGDFQLISGASSVEDSPGQLSVEESIADHELLPGDALLALLLRTIALPVIRRSGSCCCCEGAAGSAPPPWKIRRGLGL